MNGKFELLEAMAPLVKYIYTNKITPFDNIFVTDKSSFRFRLGSDLRTRGTAWFGVMDDKNNTVFHTTLSTMPLVEIGMENQIRSMEHSIYFVQVLPNGNWTVVTDNPKLKVCDFPLSEEEHFQHSLVHEHLIPFEHQTDILDWYAFKKNIGSYDFFVTVGDDPESFLGQWLQIDERVWETIKILTIDLS